jgi:membrane protease YdiL (CAAX protease family)/MFS family permease
LCVPPVAALLREHGRNRFRCDGFRVANPPRGSAQDADGGMSSQLRLLGARRLLPLFLTQTLGAFEDNLFKSAFVMLVTYGTAIRSALDPGLLAAVAGGALIAPFFLFSALAGELADRFERARLLQILKAAELATVLAALAALLADSLVLCFLALFALGAQATFSSPVRYALLPQHLGPDELVDGNALLEGGTFLAILLGTIAGSIAVAIDYGTAIAGLLLAVCAIGGLAASLFVPPAAAASPGLRLRRNPIAATADILRHARESREVWLAILASSWFWLVGAVFLSQIPSFAKETLGAGSGVVTLFLAAFSIGVGLGSVLCGRLMQGEVSARYVPLAALGMAAFSVDLALASRGAMPAADGELLGIAAFLSRWMGARIFADLLLLAICGGLYVVPLYAIIQRRSEAAARARIIAAGNIMNALFMTLAAADTAAMLAAGFGTPDLYLGLGIMNAGVALWVCKLLPPDAMRRLPRLLRRWSAAPAADRRRRNAATDRRPRGWAFIDLAKLGVNTRGAYARALLRIILYPVAAAVLLGLAIAANAVLHHRSPGSIAAIAAILEKYGLIVVAGAAVVHSVVRIHRRPWRSLIAPDLRIDWRRIAIGLGVGLAILVAELAGVHEATGAPWRLGPLAALPALALGLVLIPLQSATEELLFRGYLTQALGRITRSRVMIAAAVGVVFGLLHLNAYGALTVAYFLVVSLTFSLVSLRDERLELAIGGHSAMNLFAFAAANSGLIGAAIIGVGARPMAFNWVAIVVMAVNGALFYGITRLLVRLCCDRRAAASGADG